MRARAPVKWARRVARAGNGRAGQSDLTDVATWFRSALVLAASFLWLGAAPAGAPPSRPDGALPSRPPDEALPGVGVAVACVSSPVRRDVLAVNGSGTG